MITGTNNNNKAPLKVYFFINSFSSGMSGGDTRIVELIKRLKIRHSFIVTSNIGKERFIKEGLDNRKIKYLITTNEKKFTNFIKIYFNRILNSFKFKLDLNNSIIYSSSEFWPDILYPFIKKVAGHKFKWVAILHLKAPNPFYGPEQNYLKNKQIILPSFRSILFKLTQLISIKILGWKADAILVVNKETYRYLLSKSISQDKLHIVLNGIDIKRVNSIQPSKDSYDAVFIGRFHPQKGIHDLLRITSLIKNTRHDFKLALIGFGDKEIEKNIRTFIINNDLTNQIHFLGEKYGNEKFAIIKSAKVMFLPSYFEAFPFVILESLACNVPVLCYKLPPFKSIFNFGLYYIPLKNEVKFAKKAIDLIYHSYSPLLNNEKKKIENNIHKFDWDVITANEKKLLLKKMENKRLPSRKDPFYYPHLFSKSEKRRLNLILKNLKGRRFLDAGCGRGTVSLQIAKRKNCSVYAIDIADSVLAQARKVIDKDNSNIILEKMSLEKLHYSNDYFDSIIAADVIEHVPNLKLVLLELRRVLKNNGRLLVSVPNSLTFGFYYDYIVSKLIPLNKQEAFVYKKRYKKIQENNYMTIFTESKDKPDKHVQHFTIKKLLRLLQQNNFKIIKVYNLRFLSPYFRTFFTLLGKFTPALIESADNIISDYIPHNIAADWLVVTEKIE